MADQEKTGGTPNEGRMAPGKEGRGGHRIQRRPIIEEGELNTEMKKLGKQAATVAEFMGHETETWRSQPDENSASLRCVKCLVTSGYALNPMWEQYDHPADAEKPKGKRRQLDRQKEQINGPLFEERCKR